MDPEIQALKQELQAIRQTQEADHKMIQGIYRRIRLSSTLNVVKWVVLIGFSLGAFYFVQPLLETLIQTYSGIGGGSANSSSSSASSTVDLFRSLLN